MSRSLWKGPYIGLKFSNNKHNALIISRNSEIIPKFVGLTFQIHNGKQYTNLVITKEMIGHKFGEFSFTRSNFVSHKKLKKK